MRYLLILIISLPIFAQDGCDDISNNTIYFSNANTGVNTKNGLGFTPFGEYRALVIFVNIEDSFLNTSLQLPTWPIDEEFPIHNGQSVVKPDGSLVWAHNKLSSFNTTMSYSSNDDMLNISEYFYHMSGGNFKFYAETLKHPTNNNPISIKINPSSVDGNYLNLLDLVKSKINEIYPSKYDWSRFDNRENKNNFNTNDYAEFSDNVFDNVIDYAIIVIRNKNTWNNNPFGSNLSWPKAIASLTGSLHNEQLSFPYIFGGSNNGHVYFKFQNNLASRIELHLHEIAHNFMSMPHVNKTNAAVGDYFHFSNGITIMDKYEWFMPMANAWEMWINGWIELDYDIDINNYNANEDLILKDILTERSAIRVKLPHVCDQYVWLQNHKIKTIPYYKRKFSLPVDGNDVPALQPNLGLYAFVESLNGSRETPTYISKANSFKPLHGLGNFDYVNNGIYTPSWGFNQDVLKLQTVSPNPYSDQSLTSSYWNDGINGYAIDDVLSFSRFPNGNGGSSGVEAYRIWEVDDNAVWGNLGSDMNITQQKISAFTNPPITNLRKSKDVNIFDNQLVDMQPTILHSLSISFDYLSNDDISVNVDYNDGVIEDDFRATGNMFIPSNEHIKIANSKLLHIDKTGTANRKYALDDTFFEPSRLIIADQAKLTLKSDSKIILENDSSMIFKSGSELELEANTKIIVKSGSLLCIDPVAIVDNSTDGLPKIIVEGGFYDGPQELLDNPTNSFTGFPNIFDPNELCNNTNTSAYFHDTNNISIPPSCGNLTLNFGDVLKITSSSMITINGDVVIENGGNFEAYITDIDVGDCNQIFDLNGLLCETSNLNSIPSGYSKKINEKSIISDIILYPNPLGKNQYLNISFPKSTTDIYNVKFFDIHGRILKAKIIERNSKNVSINLSNLNKGIYILKATSSKNKFVKKVIIN